MSLYKDKIFFSRLGSSVAGSIIISKKKKHIKLFKTNMCLKCSTKNGVL